MLTVIALVVGLGLIGWMLTWNHTSPRTHAGSGRRAVAAEARASASERQPTPLFATEGNIKLHMMIDPTQITALAFHQASGKIALHMTSLVPDADMNLAARIKAVPSLDPSRTVAAGVWDGCCLRLWRSNRSGQPDTAADMGANPGTPIWSPVTGTVTQVKPYLLYDKYPDFEIHIRPQGCDNVDAVLIHVQNPRVQAGQEVKAGVTQLAEVRKMSDKIDIQLGGYTKNGGDHTHLQLNRVDPAAPAEATPQS